MLIASPVGYRMSRMQRTRIGIGMRVAQRIVRRAVEFVTAVEALRRGSTRDF